MLIIDLSSNNAAPDWRKLRANGVGGVFLKATEGEHYLDPHFKMWRDAANTAGIRVGAYHFARPDLHKSPGGEALNFSMVVERVRPSDLRPVLDFETRAMHPELQVAWCRGWNAVVKQHLGVGPLFYSYPYFMQEMHADKPIGYGLWLASYSRNDGVEHPYSVPAPWKKALIHQYTSNGHVFGEVGRVDLNAFDYDPKQFSQTQGWPPAILAHPWSFVLPPFFTRYGV